MTKILVLSDLHVDVAPFTPVDCGRRLDEGADVVVLAGDIHEGIEGLVWARKTFPDKVVVYVAGNHEFYRQQWVAHLDVMREVAQKLEIRFLENDSAVIAGVRFLGCSLWTNFALFGEDRRTFALQYALDNLNDFRLIKTKPTPELYWTHRRRLLPILTAHRHNQSVEWLSQELSTDRFPKTVVVTHHAPHMNSVPPRYEADLLSAAYASDLNYLMGKAGLWIHGHIHESADYVIGGTRVLCNPRGYLTRSGGIENATFNPTLFVEV